jgi:hypothetical protein
MAKVSFSQVLKNWWLKTEKTKVYAIEIESIESLSLPRC